MSAPIVEANSVNAAIFFLPQQTPAGAVERHGGLDVVMEKIVQMKQATPEPQGLGMIDDFRLRGSRTWRRRGGHLTKGGRLTEVAHLGGARF